MTTIGCYKDQKAYLYFESGYVDSIYSHYPPDNGCDIFLLKGTILVTIV